MSLFVQMLIKIQWLYKLINIEFDKNSNIYIFLTDGIENPFKFLHYLGKLYHNLFK